MKNPKTTSPGGKAAPKSADGNEPERIAKVIARAGVCSRRDAEAYILDGRVQLNGKVLTSPAITVKEGDVILVDGQPLPKRDRTRLWMFHKPRGLVTTNFDPEGRQTVFSVLPPELPRVMTVGRLDINTEGLLLLTNDGGLSRVLELPATGWLRRYRVRAHGTVDQAMLDKLRDGVTIDGVMYGAIEAVIDRVQGDNVWVNVGLREGKNREVKNIFAYLGMDVTRLIRISFGPFQLGELAVGAVEEVPRRVLKEQLGDRLANEASADFELREGERQPVQRVIGIAEQARSAARDDEDAPERKGRIARPKKPDAYQTKRRHDSDVDHRAGKKTEAAPNRSRPTLGTKSERAPAGDRVVLKTRPRAEDGEGPRVSRQGKSFDVAKKPRTVRTDPPAAKPGRPARPVRAREDDERPVRAERPARSSASRSERPAHAGRPERPARDARPARDERSPRDERPSSREERPQRSHSSARPERTGRDERPSAPRSERPARDDRPARSAPSRSREDRPSKPGPKPHGGGDRPKGPRKPDADRRR